MAFIVGYIVIALSFLIAGYILGVSNSLVQERQLYNKSEVTYEIIIDETVRDGEMDATIHTYSMYIDQDPKTADLIIKGKEAMFLEEYNTEDASSTKH